MKCHYCTQPAVLCTGVDVYPHRPDLAAKKFFRCVPCQAHVGCHPGTEKPLGRLATAELRKLKIEAHDAFDPMWRGRQMKRKAAYSWLAERMGIPVNECHIGMFNEERCRAVVAACKGAN